MLKKKKNKLVKKGKLGSALVFTLIIFSIMIVIAIGVFSTSVTDEKNSSSTEKSISAFQSADTGVEMSLEKINHSIITGGANMSISDANLCSVDDEVEFSRTINNRKFTVTFFDQNGHIISDCDDLIGSIKRIKSIGEFGGVVRAVQVEVTP